MYTKMVTRNGYCLGLLLNLITDMREGEERGFFFFFFFFACISCWDVELRRTCLAQIVICL